MDQLVPNLQRPRSVLRGIGGLLVALTVAACGSTAPATQSPSQAASVAPPSVAPSIASPSAAATPAPSAPAASASPAADAAAGLTIGAPYTMTALPPALQTTMEQQMAAGLGAFGGAITTGFRQISGGAGTSILMVLAFPSGTLDDQAYQAALAGMGTSMGATFSKQTVDGIEVATGKASTGGVGVFHVDDHMLVVIAQTEADVLPVATALIAANK
jgi:hypothetical protein